MKYFLSKEQKEFVQAEYCVFTLTGELNTIFSIQEAIHLVELAVSQMNFNSMRRGAHNDIIFNSKELLLNKFHTCVAAIETLINQPVLNRSTISDHFYDMFYKSIPNPPIGDKLVQSLGVDLLGKYQVGDASQLININDFNSVGSTTRRISEKLTPEQLEQIREMMNEKT